MADKKPEASDSAPPKKKPKLLLFIIIGVLLLVLAGGGVAFFLMKKNANVDEEDGEVATKADKKSKREPEAPPIFVKLEPFTVKLQVEQQEAYVQATPELRVLDAPVGDRVKQYMPEIRHKVLLIMSGKKSSELSTPQGVQGLSNEIRVAVNGILDGQPNAKGKAADAAAAPKETAAAHDSVQAVLFTSFIIQ